MNARNSVDALAYTGLTHVTIVGNYCNDGKEIIKARCKTIPSIYVNECLDETAVEQMKSLAWRKTFYLNMAYSFTRIYSITQATKRDKLLPHNYKA